MAHWVDPRSNPTPPYTGPERLLAQDEIEVAGLIAACKHGRVYDAESWIESGRPLQVDPAGIRRATRPVTPLSVSIAARSFDLVRLLLCNGYRTALEPRSPLNAVLDARRWDLLGLLLGWGSAPAGADLWRVLDAYDRRVFERFWASGMDLTAAMPWRARLRPPLGTGRFTDSPGPTAIETLASSVPSTSPWALSS